MRLSEAIMALLIVPVYIPSLSCHFHDYRQCRLHNPHLYIVHGRFNVTLLSDEL